MNIETLSKENLEMSSLIEKIKPEPFKIHSVSPLKILTQEERLSIIKSTHYNIFSVRSDQIFIDLLTDSGTTAMSDAQWSAIMIGDEAYGSATSWFKLEDTLKDIFGYKHILPAHQGRGAEKILFTAMIK